MKLSVYKNDELIDSIVVDELQLDQGIIIGRGSSVDLKLTDQNISREHAEIKRKDKKIIIEKRSAHGELIHNGNFIEQTALRNKDHIKIGSYSIHIELSEEQSADLDANAIHPDGQVDTNSEEKAEVSSNAIEEESVLSEKQESEEMPVEDASAGDSEDSLFVSEEEPQDFDQQEDHFQQNEDQSDHESADEFGESETSEEYSEDESHMDQMDHQEEEDVGEKTSLISSFVEYELQIFGDKSSYDKYAIKDNETLIGRDPEKCQIVLDDSEVSSEHAMIVRDGSRLVLKDLNSSNGTLLNGQKINEGVLGNNDEFIIGSTTFTLAVRSDLLSSESDKLMPVEENQSITVEEEVEGDAFVDDTSTQIEGDFDKTTEIKKKGKKDKKKDKGPAEGLKALFSKDALKNPEKRKKLLIGAVVILGLLVLLDEEEAPKKGKKVASKEEKSNLLVKKKKGEEKEIEKKKPQRKLSAEEKEFVESTYILAKELFNQGKYSETLAEIQKVLNIDPEYKNSKQLSDWAKQGLAKLEELERKRRKEIERKLRDQKVEKLIEKATKAVKEKNVTLAEGLFANIAELDPENLDMPQLKLELDAWKKEQERIALAKAEKEARRKRMVGQLRPGKTSFIKKEWYKAVVKLEEFLREEDMDEDLIKEGSTMLAEAKKNLNNQINPLSKKAKSLKEGQDLKGAYQQYLNILSLDPTHEESLNEISNIRDKLDRRSKKAYRQAIILESLSLFRSAMEKFQEVQQISPTDSDYYKKATLKLKDYID